MIIGIPKEIKNHEYRVGATPSGVFELVSHNHQVLVEHNAGINVGFSNQDYTEAGATIIETAAEVFAKAEMIIKVKEPQAVEIAMLRPDQILFTYLHLAADLPQTKGLIASKCVAIAYETITDRNGRLPLLAPMSEVAGRMAIQVGAQYLQKTEKGQGILMGGVPGVAPAKVIVFGGGYVGENAARMAMGLGADVTILNRSVGRLKELDRLYGPQLKTLQINKNVVKELIKEADIVVGAALVHGAKAPHLITRDQLKTMKKGAVLVDVSIDQGGCFETSRATTHQDPIYVIDDVIHYCVANMPGAVAKTATLALTNVTLPFALKIANHGWQKACQEDAHLRNGLNVVNGEVTYQAVASTFDYPFVNSEKVIS